MSKTQFLFDLDGTLTDPAEGITGAVAYALEKLGLPVPPRRDLECFIGPPLDEAFAEFYGLTKPDIDKAVVWFREYFTRQGIFENAPYPGVAALLAQLKAGGHILHVATSKPEVFAKRILERFDLARYFTHVVGSPLELHGSPKAEIVAEVLRLGGIAPQAAIMIGDRKHDVLGAHENGVKAVGILYGYGSYEELHAAGAEHIVGDIPALGQLLPTL